MLLRYFFVTCCITLFSVKACLGGELNVSTYYTSVSGKYRYIRLVPRSSAVTCDSSKNGLIYYNKDSSQLMVCRDSIWSHLGGPWESVDFIGRTDVYLKDTGLKSLYVGMGTVNPEFRLTLDKGASLPDGGILAIGTYGSGQDLVTSGAGTRFIWYPKKAAFRVGYVDGNQWDDVNIGDYSIGLGVNSLASGESSVSISGISITTKAEGDFSVAFAGGTATGSASFAFGGDATGADSLRIGTLLVSGGSTAEDSVAIGQGAMSLADVSLAVGEKVQAHSYCLSVFGSQNEWSSTYSLTSWVDTDPLFEIGGTNDLVGSATMSVFRLLKNAKLDVGEHAVTPEFRLTLDKGASLPDGGILAIGTYGSGSSLTTAGGGTRFIWYPKKAAFRAGWVNSSEWDDINIGDFSLGLGGASKATGVAGTAISSIFGDVSDYATGIFAGATGDYSLALGNSGIAEGVNSVVIGGGAVEAAGDGSMCIGAMAPASGIYSLSFGSAGAQAAYSVAMGYYSISAGSLTSWIDTDPLFVIGRGSIIWGAPENIFTLLKNGNICFGFYSSSSYYPPRSKVVVKGYVQEDTISGAPPAGDCSLDYAGRMKFDSANNRLYICNGTTWVHADLY